MALNITLTAVNSALSIATLPLLLAGSLFFFMEEGRFIPPQFGKIVQVFAVVLVPVAIGMLLRARDPPLATRMDKPVKIFATLFLIFAATFAIISAWDTMVKFFAELGTAVVTFCLLSFGVGYSVPRLLKIGPRQATAISMEIGLHNGALAIAIALSPMILNSPVMAVPPALYGVISPFIAAAFAFLLSRSLRQGARMSPQTPMFREGVALIVAAPVRSVRQCSRVSPGPGHGRRSRIAAVPRRRSGWPQRSQPTDSPRGTGRST